MKVIFVVGPTASGKSRFALQFARRNQCEILNADSLQVYKELNIGTAKPTHAEMVEVPHHLFDFVSPPQVLTAGDYRRLALDKLKECEAKNVKAVLVVGGSGFYIQALEKGMFDFGKVSLEITESVNVDLKEKGLSFLFEELQSHDPGYAEKIGPNDTYRIQRALEVLREFGATPSQMREVFKPEKLPYPFIKIGFMPERERLKSHIAERVLSMMNAGLEGEVRSLLDNGLAKWPPLESVGYKETVRFLNSEISHDECVKLITQNTQRLAKRQSTWFRRETEIEWFNPDEGFDRPNAWLHSRLS